MIPFVEVGFGLGFTLFGLGIVYLNFIKLRRAVWLLRSTDTLDMTTIDDGAIRTVTGVVQQHPDHELFASPSQLDTPDCVFCEWIVDEGHQWGRLDEGEIGTTALLDIDDRQILVDFTKVSQAHLSHDDTSPAYFEGGSSQTALESFLKEHTEYTSEFPNLDPSNRRVITKSLTPGDSITVTGVVSRTQAADSPAGIALTPQSGPESDTSPTKGLTVTNWSATRSFVDLLGRVLIVVFGVYTAIVGVLIGSSSYYSLPFQQYTTESLLVVIVFTFAYVSMEHVVYRLMGSQAAI